MFNRKSITESGCTTDSQRSGLHIYNPEQRLDLNLPEAGPTIGTVQL
jgi:hypothetical protein